VKKQLITTRGNSTPRELRYVTFDTDEGWVGIFDSTKGLLSTTLPQRSIKEARQLLDNGAKHAAWSPYHFEDLVKRFLSYFSGQQAAFPDELDLSEATSFQRKVWEATKLIPYGDTRSYIWVAEQIKQPGAARAVGQALSANPLPVIIPCHRVLSSDGKLGGFSGGVEIKRRLLSLEASS
jgi:methylated-DNA-[protein]-cysteine S-methyltransferase